MGISGAQTDFVRGPALQNYAQTSITQLPIDVDE